MLWALELNNGMIYDNLGIDADIVLPVPGEPGSLGHNMAQGVLGHIFPVYRFDNLILAKHLFTCDENEKITSLPPPLIHGTSKTRPITPTSHNNMTPHPVTKKTPSCPCIASIALA